MVASLIRDDAPSKTVLILPRKTSLNSRVKSLTLPFISLFLGDLSPISRVHCALSLMPVLVKDQVNGLLCSWIAGRSNRQRQVSVFIVE
jgi:hypothetical protein